MARAALEDAGLKLADADALFSCTGGALMHSVELAEDRHPSALYRLHQHGGLGLRGDAAAASRVHPTGP